MRCLRFLPALLLVGCVELESRSRFEAMGAAAADLAYAALEPVSQPASQVKPEPSAPDRGQSAVPLVEGTFNGSQAQAGEGVPILVPAGERPPLDGTVDYQATAAIAKAEPVSQSETVRVCGPGGCQVITRESETVTVDLTPTYEPAPQYVVKRGLFGRPKFKRSRGGRSCGPGGCG